MIKYEEVSSLTKKEDQNKSLEVDYLINTILLNQYKLLKKIGRGSFGNIYLSQDIFSKEFFAIKLEKKNSTLNTLETESNIIKYLNCDKIPFIKKYDQNIFYNILIMQLLGKSLEDIFEQILHKEKMTINCVCNLVIQMIEILEQIHNKNIIHRDIKPSNFLFGNEGSNNNLLYLIDFGLAKKYREYNNSKHYEINEEKRLIGTARFASINAMNGLSQSRRDDLESLGYVLIYFLKGKLPWQNLLIKNKEERYEKIRQIKNDIEIKDLCGECPLEIGEYITYVKNLKYEEEPNYDFMKNIFRNLLNKLDFKFGYSYDWDNSKTIIDISQYKDIDLNSNDIFGDDNFNLKLPLDKIIYKKKVRKKRNKSQDKSTNDGGEESEENNNSSEQLNLQNNSGCCIIV